MHQDRYFSNKPMCLWPTDSQQNLGNFAEMRASSVSDSGRLDSYMQESKTQNGPKAWYSELLEEDVRGNNSRAPKAWEMKANIDDWDHSTLKSFGKAEEAIDQETTTEQEMFSDYSSDEG